MIAALASFKVKPGKAAEFERAFLALAAEMRLKEPGCKLYELARDPAEPDAYTVIEMFQDRAAVDDHLKADHFVAARPTLESFMTGEHRLLRLDVVR